MPITDLQHRVIEISKKKHLSHIGSCVTAVGIIDEIYDKKKVGERFVLSSGHAGLALYVVLEKYLMFDAEGLFDKHGVHPAFDPDHDIHCSSGSLGHGLGIALGMALSDRTQNVYCLVSDGECAEGSIWEALRTKADLDVKNLIVHVNINGYGAYDKINAEGLTQRLTAFCDDIHIHYTNFDDFDFLDGLSAHYITL